VTRKYLRRYEPAEITPEPIVPPCVQGGRLIIRGTEEWDRREELRRQTGCNCLSFGPIPILGGRLAGW